MAEMLSIRQICRSLWRACLRWASFDCVDLSAAFAYYTLQSIFPILLISLSLASWLLGRQPNLDDQILIYVGGVLPPLRLRSFAKLFSNLFPRDLVLASLVQPFCWSLLAMFI